MLLSAVLTLAQVAAPPVTTDVAPPSQDRLYFVEHADGTWVRGRAYKARFSPEGFRYVPFLGSEAPRNYPVDLRLRGARLGSVELELEPTATVEREGERFVLDRGPVDVLYDLSVDSIEQSFLLDAAGSEQDLVLELDVTTELAAGTRGAGHRFTGPHGGVDYGAAIVLDEAGRRAEIPTTIEGDTLRLTVPASFLASAEGMVLVDPVISTYTVDDFGQELTFPDVTFDDYNFENTYVYVERFSGGDNDVFMRSLDGFSNVVLAGAYFDASDESVSQPSVAHAQSARVSLAVAVRLASDGSTAVVGRILDESANTFGPEITIASGGPFSQLSKPDVGGNSNRLDTDPVFLVCWTLTDLQGGFEAMRFRNVWPTGAVGTTFGTADPVGSSNVDVVISKSTGGAQGADRWNMAWVRRLSPSHPWSIMVAQFDADGNLIEGPWNVQTITSGPRPVDLDVSDGLIDGSPTPTYLVSYDREGTWAASSKELLVCRRAQLIFSTNLSEIENSHMDRAVSGLSLGVSWHHPSRQKFVAVYEEYDPQTAEWTAYYTSLNQPFPGGLSVIERRIPIGTTRGPAYGSPALATRSSSAHHSLFGMVARTVQSPSNSTSDIAGATFRLEDTSTNGFQFCHGMPNSTGDRGFLRLVGDRSTTNAKTLEASALPPNVFGFFIMGQGAAPVPGAGGSAGTLCIGGAGIGRDNQAVLLTTASGTTSRLIDPTQLVTPTGMTAAVAGEVWNFQFWHRDVMGGMATSNYTNAVGMWFL